MAEEFQRLRREPPQVDAQTQQRWRRYVSTLPPGGRRARKARKDRQDQKDVSSQEINWHPGEFGPLRKGTNVPPKGMRTTGPVTTPLNSALSDSVIARPRRVDLGRDILPPS